MIALTLISGAGALSALNFVNRYVPGAHWHTALTLEPSPSHSSFFRHQVCS